MMLRDNSGNTTTFILQEIKKRSWKVQPLSADFQPFPFLLLVFAVMSVSGEYEEPLCAL